jgi:hypothetical protein
MVDRAEKRSFSRKPLWLMVGLILTAFALYTYRLDAQSLWRDEILSLGRARQPLSLLLANRNLVRGVESPDLHPPFYFLLLSGWHRLAGETEFAYRYMSVLLACVALSLFYAVGKRIWGGATGLWAAFTAVLSPFYFWHAQETRMYLLLLVTSLLLLYTVWRLLQPGARWQHYALFALVSALTIYTHYTGLILFGFAIGAILLNQLFNRGASLLQLWKPVFAVLIGLALVAIPLYENVKTLLSARGFVAFGARTPLPLLYDALSTFSLGSANPPGDTGIAFWPFVLLAVLGALAVGAAPSVRRWRVVLLSVGGLMGTLLLFYLASFLQANYANPRHLTVLSMFWFLLIGHGLATLGRFWRVGPVIAWGVLLLFGGQALWKTVTQPDVVRDDVRSLAAYIEARALPGDGVIWHDAVMSLVYDYYAPDLPYTAVPNYNQFDAQTALDELAVWQQEMDRIWFVRYPEPFFFDASVLPEALREEWILIDGAGFPASWSILGLELFQPFTTSQTLPADLLPAEIVTGNYSLTGVQVPPGVSPGNGVWASLYWRLTGEISAVAPKACLQLFDSAGGLWSEGCTHLLTPTFITPAPTEFVQQQVWLPLPEGLAPIPYQLSLSINDATQNVGLLNVARPAAPTSHDALASFENGLTILDVTWFDEEFRAGLWLLGSLLWQVDQPLDGPVTLEARLLDWRGQTITAQTLSPAPVDYPASAWQTNDVIRANLALRLPHRLDGTYRVQLSLRDEAQEVIRQESLWPGKTWVNVGLVRVADWPYTDSLPPSVAALADDVFFGDGAVQLAAYELRREGEQVMVDLYWRVIWELAADYGTFIHLGVAETPPEVVGGGVNWERPSSSWRAGEIIKQSFTLSLPEGGLPASAIITTGLYDLNDPADRLPLRVNGTADATNAYELGPLP